MPEFMMAAAMLLGILNTALFGFMLLSFKELRKSVTELSKIANSIVDILQPSVLVEEVSPDAPKTESQKMEEGIFAILNYKIEDALKEKNYVGD
jgi:hypothetical protein